MIRAFIAIELPEDVRGALAAAQDRLKRAHVGVKISWAKIENIHLTLQFLGNVEEPTLDRISETLAELAQRHAAFDLVVQGTGAFPNLRAPRVLWGGCVDAMGQLAALAGAVQTAMATFGFPPEHRPFAAHLTLGRVKPALSRAEGFPRPDAALTRALDSLKNTDFGTMRVDAVHLFQSQLHPAGSIYTKLSSHKLM
jgi:2'-5' RNA ligase